MSIIDQFSFWR